MKIPTGMTEEAVVEIINKVSRGLAPIYRFGHHSIEDIQQQARIYAIEGLETFDGKRPLENFLWTHVRNRLYNNKRDNYERPDKPCFKCPFNAYDPKLVKSDSGCILHHILTNCDLYDKWYKRNAPKRNLMNTTDIENINDEKENNMRTMDDELEKADSRVIFDILDKSLPIEYREDYIKLKYGLKVTRKRKEEILTKIKEILKEHGIEEEAG